MIVLLPPSLLSQVLLVRHCPGCKWEHRGSGELQLEDASLPVWGLGADLYLSVQGHRVIRKSKSSILSVDGKGKVC